MIRFPEYTGEWYDKKIEKVGDALKSTFIAVILYCWTIAAAAYTTAKFIYEMLHEVAVEIHKNKKEDKKK